MEIEDRDTEGFEPTEESVAEQINEISGQS